MASTRRKKISLSGIALMREPLLNKGTAFTAEERKAFGLDGLLPYRSVTIEEQARRVYERLSHKADPLEKHVALAALHDRNECLYFYLLRKYLEQLLPIVYTPTVGLATMRFSHVFQRGRGVWITPDLAGSIAQSLRRAAGNRDIRLIVITDNESILGLGDQGAGGIAISIGKLAIYTAAAGIDPATVLPVSLDVGTENQDLLDDPMYLGWPSRRVRGAEYEALLDEFVAAVKSEFPEALVQWEDFRKDNALRVMDRYRDEVLSFNDDIEGTGAVALAGLLCAGRVHGRPLAEERVVIVGAGAAGLGVFRQLRAALQATGLRGDKLRQAIAVLDSRGLVVDDGHLVDAYKQEFAWTPAIAEHWNLAGADRGLQRVCDAYRPTVLIGTSGQHAIFNESVVRSVAAAVDRPVILPMSNPTAQSEAVPDDILTWTAGRALIAAGSPFDDAHFGGRRFRVGQANNAFIFPGLGLGVLLSGVRRITDRMFLVAGEALAASVTDDELKSGLLFPPVCRLCEVSVAVARAVMHDAVQTGIAESLHEDEIEMRLATGMWSPEYPDFGPVSG